MLAACLWSQSSGIPSVGSQASKPDLSFHPRWKLLEERWCCLAQAAEPCLQTAGMWDVWSGGQEARKECQVCPCLSRADSPFSPQWRAAKAGEYKGSQSVQSELRPTPLPKLNSSFHREQKQGRVWPEQRLDNRLTSSEKVHRLRLWD